MKVILNSRNGEVGEAELLEKVGDNEYIFLTEDGVKAHGIFNPFTCYYYVDDKYYIIHD